MLAEERRKLMRNKLSRDGQLLSAELIREFKVSEDTIRRDLKELADEGLLRKVHGGAMAVTTVPIEYAARHEMNVEAKSAMALQAVSLVRSGMLVFVDGATTTALIANHLPSSIQTTFVTNSIATATALSILPRSEIILLGGKLIRDLLITTGPELIQDARVFRPDLSIIGVHGLTITAGATVENYDDALIKQYFVQNSGEVAVLAGHEKLGFIASYFVAPLSQISYLVCDAPNSSLSEYNQAGITVWKV